MTNIRISSIQPPFADKEIYPRATRFLRRADAMGLLEEPVEELSAAVVRRVAQRLSRRGLARDVAVNLAKPKPSPEEYAAYFDAAARALEESPVPQAELAKLQTILDQELLTELLDVSAASLQRYQKGTRETPDDVADRAHFLTEVIAALEGTYNEFGIRRWFDRPRTLFGGRTARQLLSQRWKPQGQSAQRVLSAAQSLQHLGAT